MAVDYKILSDEDLASRFETLYLEQHRSLDREEIAEFNKRFDVIRAIEDDFNLERVTAGSFYVSSIITETRRFRSRLLALRSPSIMPVRVESLKKSPSLTIFRKRVTPVWRCGRWTREFTSPFSPPT